MNWLRRAFHKSHAEKSLDKELQFHLDRQIADYVAVGMQPAEARRRARLEFGALDSVKEEVRDTRWEIHLAGVAPFYTTSTHALDFPGGSSFALLFHAKGGGLDAAPLQLSE
jgi:hypothetical protein